MFTRNEPEHGQVLSELDVVVGWVVAVLVVAVVLIAAEVLVV